MCEMIKTPSNEYRGFPAAHRADRDLKPSPLENRRVGYSVDEYNCPPSGTYPGRYA
jgi:hypothetical protein